MNIPTEAIEKAIEGGWEPQGYDLEGKALSWKVQALDKVKFKERFALDPTFWQALGNKLDEDFEKSQFPNFVSFNKWDWKLNAHRFCDIIYQSKSTDEFWRSMLE